jgi:hypothetical protein
MSRVLLVKSSEGDWEVDYSKLSLEEIDQRIKAYQEKYGKFRTYSAKYDCDASSPQDYLAFVDWESLLLERKKRTTSRKSRRADQ